MLDERKSLVPVEVKLDGESGAFVARFSVFNQLDKDNDVTLPGAFEDGASVKIAAWGHNWLALPVGKGRLVVDDHAARVQGQFFLNTQGGRETYETVKALGPDQEWSYGFKVVEADYGDFDGKQVRFLRKLHPFEVSPVLVGAGNDTGTEGIKAFDDFQAQVRTVLAANDNLLATVKARADVRGKEGRVLSGANRDVLAPHPPVLRRIADEVEALLNDSAPKKHLDENAARRWSLLVASSMEAFGLTAD